MAYNYPLHLGKLLGNLHSLEVLLRVYLLGFAQNGGPSAASKVAYWNLSVGDAVEENEFTNYDTLGKLIDRFNANVEPQDPKLRLDTAVVSVRDLLAHGRVSADQPSPDRLKILKFGKASGGVVKVTACALMDEKWFAEQNTLVREQLFRVREAYNRFAT